MESKFNPEQYEQLDAIDHLIIDELGRQQKLRRRMQEWDLQLQAGQPASTSVVRIVADERRRAQRRLQLVPIISNILSVAALMTVGFILQAVMPAVNATTQVPADHLSPHIEQATPAGSQPAGAIALPGDSAALQP